MQSYKLECMLFINNSIRLTFETRHYYWLLTTTLTGLQHQAITKGWCIEKCLSWNITNCYHKTAENQTSNISGLSTTGSFKLAHNIKTLRLLSIWSQTIADRRKFCDHMETHFCDRLQSWSQKIRPILFYRLRSYGDGDQSSAICDRNVSHNVFNFDRWFNAWAQPQSPNVRL